MGVSDAVGCLMGLFAWWNIPRRGWMIILSELVVIVSLGGSIILEYFNNVYFQTYVNSLAPVLIPVLSVAFGVISATIATVLYLGTRNIRRLEVTAIGEEPRKKSHAKKSPRKPTSADSKPTETKSAKSSTFPVGPSRLRPLAPAKTTPPRENSSTAIPAEKKNNSA